MQRRNIYGVYRKVLQEKSIWQWAYSKVQTFLFKKQTTVQNISKLSLLTTVNSKSL